MSLAKIVSLILGFLTTAWLVVLAVFKKNPLTYVSVLRYPLLLALGLNFLAWAASRGSLGPMLGNLFQLRTAGEVFVAAMTVAVTGLAIVFTGVLLARALGQFFGLPVPGLRPKVEAYVQRRVGLKPPGQGPGSRAADAAPGPNNSSDTSNQPAYQQAVAARYNTVMVLLIAVLALLVTAWPIFTVVTLSVHPALSRLSATGAALAGLAAAALVAFLCWRMALWINKRLNGMRGKQPQVWPFLLRAASWLERGIRWMFGTDQLWHLSALVLFVITLGIYLLLGQIYNPGNGPPAPALIYVFLIFLLATWTLPALSFVLYRLPGRIPVLLVLLAVSAFMWVWRNTDNFYAIEADPALAAEQVQQPFTPEAAFAQWLSHKPQEEYPTLVLVTANGGGIRAALWTTVVLRRLQQELGSEFSGAIALISSVSGGSVGSMYFVDAFQEDGPPSDEALNAVVAAARQPSLAHAAYGVAYSDVPRLFLGSFVSHVRDRGWRLEQAWAQHLLSLNQEGQDGAEPRLNDWRADIRRGIRPLVIFNASNVESGERFLLTPLDPPTSDCQAASSQWQRKYLYFNDCYPGSDLRISTAARMSSSFPYITPNSRPISGTVPVSPGYHLADGGYVDNNGLLSAIDWLDQVKEVLTAEAGCTLNAYSGVRNDCPAADDADYRQPRRLLIVHIRSADGFRRPAANESLGWVYSLVGPLATLVNSWNTNQIGGDDVNVKQFDSLLPPTFPVEQVFFAYCGPGPLSWQLSDAEARELEEGFGNTWPDCLHENPKELEKARTFFTSGR